MTTVFDREFRFTVCVFSPARRSEWVRAARRAEELGYDVLAVSDHLGGFAPVPTVATIAAATSRLRTAIYVSSSTLYQPRVLARDYATLDQYSDGRVEIGLGAGYSRAEFESAGLPWRPAAERVDALERAALELRNILSEKDFRPTFAQRPGPPIAIAGRGDRVLRLAAAHADIIGFSGSAPVPDGEPLRLADPAEIRNRVEYVHGLLGARIADVEFAIPVHRVLPHGARGPITDVWQNEVRFSGTDLREHPSILIGTPRENADKLRALRARFGFSYFNVMESEMEAFADVIAELRPAPSAVRRGS
ncbi:TIGR03621 family F420-dependent LLM class oxidoreductase [Nocardia asteroides]|uniref:TIGR03621 family F420-dependent LLM class oxidoreductase n=1 Tax=Nocardia asteroides TaxID=1824 RepID=UPI001E5CE50B|nr:TIGR03621 family F420-dependent LLM class oxidoreductase [Nocardia asteroides]UGT55277.1 TIGR03621 family F420-dependent LLM class oxidoreductase [Nocardia asteroides]